jgi:hypothetical protein
VPLQLPLRLVWNRRTLVARTANVSDTGALVLSPVQCPIGSTVEITNLETEANCLFDVLWSLRDESQEGPGCRLGVRARPPAQVPEGAWLWGRAFWGGSYRQALSLR